MENGSFTFNGKSSTDFKLFIGSRPARTPPQKVLTTATPSNRNGSVYRDMGTYKNSTLEIEATFKVADVSIEDLTDWLQTSDYGSLILYYDPLYTYKAIIDEDIKFEYINWEHEYMTAKFSFSVHPLKTSTSSLSFVQITTGTNWKITNPYSTTSLPLFELTPEAGTINAKADVRLYVNGVLYTFKTPTEKFTVDSEIPSTTIPSKMVGLKFPQLRPGVNTITIEGVSNARVIPRFVRRGV